MIYTITANPAIDYHMDLSASGFRPGRINRSKREEMFPGGKGLNVSVVLSRLGIGSTAWGFIAGKTGALLETLAKEYGCSCDFISLPEGETRINVKLDCDEETAINGTGPKIGEEQVACLLERVKKLAADDMLILSGNLQTGTVNLYEEICRICHENGIRFVVDTDAANLKAALPYHPYLIKPNEEELLGLYNSTDRSTATAVSLMMKCQEDGAENVLVTLGGDGALFLSHTGELFHILVRGKHQVISTVGSGDSTIAGFLAGMMRCEGHYEDALRLACAAGSATACKKWLCTEEEIQSMTGSIEVCRL